MAKITRDGGPSFNEHEINDPDPPLAVRRFMLGDEAPSVGDNSAPSGQSESWSSAGVTADNQSPVQTTESHSDSHPTGEMNFTAPLTGGDGQETEAPSFAEVEDVPPYDEWSNKDLKEECRVRGLIVSGNHDELVKRLMDDDEAAADKGIETK